VRASAPRSSSTLKDGTPRVAGSAHRVDEETLERFEYDNVERVLAEVPGVSTRGEDGYGLRPNIGMRGASSDRSAKVTLMEDGVLFAPAPYAAPAAYYFPMSTRLVGVEVFKGPAATRFGPQTVGGAINLLTRRVPVGLGLRPRPRGRPVPLWKSRRIPRLWRMIVRACSSTPPSSPRLGLRSSTAAAPRGFSAAR
jgi:outer membrane receptor for Fe3+-dicitrate